MDNMKDVLKTLEPTIKKGLSRKDHRLLDARFEREFTVDAYQKRAADLQQPPPKAQVVLSQDGKTVGIAVHQAKFVCSLPAGYGGPGMELAMVDGGKMIVSQPDKTPLLIDPSTGRVTKL